MLSRWCAVLQSRLKLRSNPERVSSESPHQAHGSLDCCPFGTCPASVSGLDSRPGPTGHCDRSIQPVSQSDREPRMGHATLGRIGHARFIVYSGSAVPIPPYLPCGCFGGRASGDSDETILDPRDPSTTIPHWTGHRANSCLDHASWLALNRLVRLVYHLVRRPSASGTCRLHVRKRICSAMLGPGGELSCRLRLAPARLACRRRRQSSPCLGPDQIRKEAGANQQHRDRPV